MGLVQRIGEWEGASNGVRQAMAGQLAERGENLKGAIQQATKVFQEKQAYKRNYIANTDDAAKAADLTAKVDLEDQLYQEAVKKIWADFGNAGREMLTWLDTFLNSESDDLVAAQDAAGDLLADALSAELDRLAEALGAVGDAFFQAKHDETERLMAALYERGYGEYKAGYEPVFEHQDEEVEEPYPVEEEDDHTHYEYEEEVVEEVVEEESYSYYTYEEEVVEEVVVEEPVEEVVVEEPVEEVVVEESEDSYVYESESESESTVSYSSYSSVSSESSESYYYGHGHSHGHGHGHGHSHDYDDVEPYTPEPAVYVASEPAHYSATPAAPVEVSYDSHSDDSHSSNDVEINIYNGVGGSTVMGFGNGDQCIPREGECRPQCPEVVYNAYDNSVHFTWAEDVANCNDYPRNTWLTLYSPNNVGQSVIDDMTQNLVREVEGTAVPYGGLSFNISDVLNNGHGLACDQSYFVSGMYTWYGKTNHRVFGMPNTSPNSIYIPCSHDHYY